MKVSVDDLRRLEAYRAVEAAGKALIRSVALGTLCASGALSQAKQAIELEHCKILLEELGRGDWASDAILIAKQYTSPPLPLVNVLCTIAARGKLEPLDCEWFRLFEALGYEETVKLRYDMTATEPIDTITPTLARLAGRETV